ncbi:MAG: LD-carboxypeptidase [Pseudomonadota bacterium]
MKSNRIIPNPLKNGDVIGIAAVSGPVNPTNLKKGFEFVKALGLKFKLGKNIYLSENYLAGSDEQRVESLNDFLLNPEIRGIIFARGGYGVMRILPQVNFDAMKSDPKIMLGMSDLTALSIAAFQRCGLITIAGPMLAGQIADDLDNVTSDHLVRVLTQPLQQYDMVAGFQSEIVGLRNGETRGELLGGCLSLMVSLLGTPFSPNFSRSVLFIEEVNEPTYKIDRMLTQMKLAGVFDRVRGVIISHFSGNCSDEAQSDVEKIILEYTAASSVPVISRYPHGHELPNIPLPVGAEVEFMVSSQDIILRVI